jgi:hypothetical protein
MTLTPADLYYLNSILGNLREFRTVTTHHAPSIGTEVLSDNIDWLDCWIDKHRRRFTE